MHEELIKISLLSYPIIVSISIFMKMTIPIMLLLFSLTSCGKKVDSKLTTGGVSTPWETYGAYVDTFLEYRQLAGGPNSIDGVTIEFVPTLGPGILGTCTRAIKHIRISEQFWRVIERERREELIFHELGHCVLGRDHINTSFPNNYPTSLMNSYSMGPVIYADPAYYAYYVSEFFSVPEATFSGHRFNPSRYVSGLSAFGLNSEINNIEFKCTHKEDGTFEVEAF